VTERPDGDPEHLIQLRHFVAVVLLFLLAILVSPGLALALLVMFGIGGLLQRYEARR
jgi:hypothetical protein